MIDIPIGKALVPVESEIEGSCSGCAMRPALYCHNAFVCGQIKRKDGKNIIFKLVDYPAKDKAYLGVDIKELARILMDKHKDEVLKRLEKEISTITQNK